MKGLPCVFCGSPSSHKGEHVIPQGVLARLFPSGGGPYATFVGENKQREDNDADRPKVPCCDDSHNGCNGRLNQRFEEPYQDLVKDFWAAAASGSPTQGVAVEAANRHGLGLWFLKTMLLLAHPGRRDWFPHIETNFESLLNAPTAWPWMIDNSNEPDDIHLWVTTSDPTDSNSATFTPLSMWNDPELGNVQQRIVDCGIAGLYFTLLYHPGAYIDQEPNVGVRLWPPVEGDITWADLATPTNRLDATSRAITYRLIFVDEADPKMELFRLPFSLKQNLSWCKGATAQSTNKQAGAVVVPEPD